MEMAAFPIEVVSNSPEETMAEGEKIARCLCPGAVVALKGPLGAGKTCLTKGIARYFGVNEEVTSPTYTIISEYQGNLPFYHIDAYRLRGDEDFSAIGGEEVISGEGITVVEWSERIPQSLPDDAVVVEIALGQDGRRHIRMFLP
jgi:tRNA threonylcarbamoyladenosine biosynthesis protein TsaE